MQSLYFHLASLFLLVTFGCGPLGPTDELSEETYDLRTANPEALRPGNRVTERGGVFRVPEPGMSLTIQTTLVSGHEWVEVETSPEGKVTVRREKPEARQTLQQGLTAGDGGTSLACSSTEHLLTGWSWNRPYLYSIDGASIPPHLRSAFARSVKEASYRLVTLDNDCGLSGRLLTFFPVFSGNDSTPLIGGDGLNTVGFAPTTDPESLAQASTYSVNYLSERFAIESDILFNPSQPWLPDLTVPSTCNEQLLMMSTATHELGHVAGLDHASDGSGQTMARGAFCDASRVTLGAGDVAGLKQLYGADSMTAWCSHSTGQLLTGDFNGDHREDLLCHDTSNGYKWIAFAGPDGRYSGTSWHANLNWCSHPGASLRIGDFNGDGRDDLLCHDGPNKWTALATPEGTFTGTYWYAPMNWCSHPGGQLLLGDFNGDRHTDLLCHDGSNLWVSLAQTGELVMSGYGGWFNGTSWHASMSWCTHPGASLRIGDFNGDGRDDLLCHDTAGSKWVATAGPDGSFAGTTWAAPMNWCGHSTGQLLVGQVDGDGRDDLICHDVSSGQKWVALATPEGGFSHSYSSIHQSPSHGFCSFPSVTSADSSFELRMGDRDGDGVDDLLCRTLVFGAYSYLSRPFW